MNKKEDLIQKLKHLVPINELTHESLGELARHTSLKKLSTDRKLFRQGEESHGKIIYLLDGVISLTNSNNIHKIIQTGTQESCFAIDPHTPHQFTATAKSDVQYIQIEQNMLDILLTWDQNTNYVVSEIEDSTDAKDNNNDWMSIVVSSKIFHNIPAANIQAIFMRLKEVPVTKGETIITQGEIGEDYYVIKQGQCEIICNSPQTGHKDTVITELRPGQSFGEEALMSDNPRNATVKMLSDGILMRLSKKDFGQLLKEPVLHTVSLSKAKDMVKQGDIWLDVRLPSEYTNAHIPGSINIPLYLLRINANKLSTSSQYIVYCDTGRRSASAVYILTEHGFNACLLQGGLKEHPLDKIT